MKKEEINAGNKLIAEFMGWKEQKDPTKRWFGSFKDTYGKLWRNNSKEPLQFHSSWDWLMPVVERVESLGFGITIGMGMYCVIQDDTSDTGIEFTGMEEGKLQSTYKAIVEFIEWYNENQKDEQEPIF